MLSFHHARHRTWRLQSFHMLIRSLLIHQVRIGILSVYVEISTIGLITEVHREIMKYSLRRSSRIGKGRSDFGELKDSRFATLWLKSVSVYIVHLYINGYQRVWGF